MVNNKEKRYKYTHAWFYQKKDARPKEEEPKKYVIIKACDGKAFEVEEKVISLSKTIERMIEDGCAKEEIPLDHVTGATMSKVIEYCKKHFKEPDQFLNPKEVEDLKKFDKKLVEKSGNDLLFDLIMAANYLEIECLLDLCCKYIANYLSENTTEKSREKFCIQNDYTPEEEAAVKNENYFAFDCESTFQWKLIDPKDDHNDDDAGGAPAGGAAGGNG